MGAVGALGWLAVAVAVGVAERVGVAVSVADGVVVLVEGNGGVAVVVALGFVDALGVAVQVAVVVMGERNVRVTVGVGGRRSVAATQITAAHVPNMTIGMRIHQAVEPCHLTSRYPAIGYSWPGHGVMTTLRAPVSEARAKVS